MTRWMMVLVAGALFLSACNNSNAKKDDDGENALCGKNVKCMPPINPVDPQVNVPASTPLSAQEEKDFLLMMKATTDTDYSGQVLVPPQESYEDRQQREDRYRRGSDTFRRQVDSIRALCTLNHPLRSETRSNESGTPRVGDRQTVVEASSIVGAGCPVTANQSSRNETVLTQVDLRMPSLAARISGTQHQELRLNDPMWVQQSGLRSQSLDMTLAGNMAYAGEDKQTLIVNMDGSGLIELASGIRLTLKITAMLGQQVDGPKQGQGLSMVMVFSGHGVDKVLHLSIKTIDGQTTTKITLNGRELSEGTLPPGVGLGGLAAQLETRMIEKASALKTVPAAL